MKYIVLLFSMFLISFSAPAQMWSELNDSLVQYYNNGEYSKAAVVGEKGIIAAKKQFGITDPEYATSLNNLAALYRNMGLYEKAESLYAESMAIRKTLGDPDYSNSLNNLAALYKTMGLYEKAEPLYLQAKEIRKKTLGETHPDYATVLNNLASLYLEMGQYEKAEPLYLQAKDIRKKVFGATHLYYATVLNNLAALYKETGQYEKAESLYLEAAAINKKVLGETHPDYGSNLHNLATLYELMTQYEKAEPLYIEAIAICKKTLGETHPDYAGSLNNLAVLYTSIGQPEKAELLYNESMSVRKKVLGESHPDYADVLNNLAELYKSMGQYEKAESLYIKATAIYKKVVGESHPYFAAILNNLAELYQQMGQYEKAELLMIQNSQIVLGSLFKNFTIFSEKEKANFITNNISLLETSNSFVYNFKKASAAILKNNFNEQLVFKSLTLADTRSLLLSAQKSSDTSIQALLKNWQISKSILSKQYAMPIANRKEDLKQIETSTENLEKELSSKSSAFRNQQNAIRISIWEVQKNLQADEVAIEFVRFHLYNKRWTDSTIYAAYILNKKDSVPVFVPLCEERQLQRLFDSAGNTATTMVSSFYRGLDVKKRSSISLGKDLYKLVWEPLEPYLKGVKKISYSPAGKLYSIAFQALPIDSTTVLMDKYQLQQYTSTRQVALRSVENQTTKPESIVLFGNASFTMDSLQLLKQRADQPEKEKVSTSIYTPQKRSSENNTWSNLPGTAEEVKKIKQLFDQNKITTKSFVQTTATEEKLKALNGNSPQILHIATHGFFLPEADKKRKENNLSNENTYTLADDPLLRSGLILAGGNYAWSGKTPIDGVEDGIATAYEISQLNLSNTELVVLSACETALGDVKGSEGVFGLQRAFKMAGVKKMIVSLWQVPDKETAELMTSFYSYWMKGKKINDAFAQAQAGMRKKYSPFYWAAFVMID